jgi:hypothetical protein
VHREEKAIFKATRDEEHAVSTERDAPWAPKLYERRPLITLKNLPVAAYGALAFVMLA